MWFDTIDNVMKRVDLCAEDVRDPVKWKSKTKMVNRLGL